MNAYKAYAKRKADEQSVKLIEEVSDTYVEHADLITLMTLHTVFGFGAERLKRFYVEYGKMHREYETQYMTDGDKKYYNLVDKETGKKIDRMDTWTLKRDLKKIGFDYDAVVAELTK